MPVETDYQDVLQNLEFTVSSYFREHPELTDFAVQQAYEAVTAQYGAEQRGTKPRDFHLNEIQQELAGRLTKVCEWRLGRAEPEAEFGDILPDDTGTIDHTILIRCLRKLQKSLPKWSKRGGRQGYLNFISEFV